MSVDPNVETSNQVEHCLAEGGQMGALMRGFDWSATSIGPVSEWPQSLKTALSILLASGYPMYIAWGPEFIQFYNDAYRPILGATKHPKALGQSTSECFAEIWDFIGPMFHRAITTGEATTLTDQLLPLDRNGYVEECYFTFSYSAIRDESGSFGGVFVTVIETTDRVLSERRVSTLREFATVAADARTTEQACQVVEKIVRRNPHDLPFTLLYLLDEAGKVARLVGHSGLEPGTKASPLTIAVEEQDVWPLGQVKDSDAGALVTDVLERFGILPGGAWPEPPHAAMVLPIGQAGHQQIAGLLVAGLSARRMLDDPYRGYLELLAGSVATVIGNARAYESERQRAEALAELDRAKTTFFSNVSHEFRTPLALILGRLEDLLAKPDEGVLPENREVLHIVYRNALRLLKLVNTLLDFSRIEAGRVQAVYEPTDLSRYTAELASMFQSAIEKAGMQLIVNCPPLAELVSVDREMWEKIVLNLLSNAFKFTESGEIEVSVQEKGEAVELAIRDTGTGIAEEQLPHIFERFHRVEGARARTQEGTGIGLALVQELVKLQGGSVRVESIYGQGSTFTVSLPLGTHRLPAARPQTESLVTSTAHGARPYVEEALRWLPDEMSAEIAKSSSMPAKQSDAFSHGDEKVVASRSCIVVADDNSDMRNYVSGLLRPDYEVIAVSDGRQALQALQERQPDLLLSDVMMPGLNGFELLQVLRSDPQTKTIPVILLSARAGEEARVEGLAARADDYLIKPFGAKELLARVASHLEMARVRKEAAEVKERLLAELKVERTRLTNLFMQAPAFMAVLRGPQHIFEMANPAYYQLVGHRDILGKTVREALPEIEGQGFFELLDEVYQTGQPFEGKEMRAFLQSEVGASLQERYLDFVYLPLVEVDSSVVGILVHGVDLTERHRAERALQASKEALALAVDGAELGTFYCTMPLDKIVWNDRCKEHFFLPHDAEVDIALFYSLLHPEDREPTRQAIERCLNERVQYNVEYRTVSPDGRVRWINAVGRAYYKDNGEPYRFDGITIDITQRMEREAQIQTLNAKLRRAMTETHHRVKNNLQLISALIEMQKQSGQELVPMSELDRLGQNIQALGVIHDILTKEAKEDGEAEFISIKGVLERLLPILRTTLGARRLLAMIEEVSLLGKQTTSLALIVNELISNAVKHGKGDVEIILRAEGNSVTLEVCDDGPGFPHSFDPETAANTGLELIETIARYDLQGETRYQNREQGGARVMVTLPIINKVAR